MNTICERIEGKLYPCKSAFENYIDLGNPYDSLQKVFKIGHIVKYCPFCGADILKSKSKQPTHEEIMTEWWKVENQWIKVSIYWFLDGGNFPYYIESGDEAEDGRWVDKGFFVNKESADIPPEA